MLPDVLGLISQVAEELWEVKDRKIKNLTKEDITIVDYKKLLVQKSMSQSPTNLVSPVRKRVSDLTFASTGYASLEKAKLFSKTTGKTKA